MKKREAHNQIVFKEYNMNQLNLIPSNISDLIPQKHLVRTVNDFVDNLDISPLLATYQGGGRSRYHPQMMLKVIVYAYTQKIFTSRMIAKALRENIHFMWISGSNSPSYRSINRFRSSRLKKCIDEVFTKTIDFLVSEGYIKLENYFLDGTIIEANANKYSFVWRKSTMNYKEKLEENIKKLIHQIDAENKKEMKDYGDNDLEELGQNSTITEEKIKNKAKEVSDLLSKLMNENQEAEEIKRKKKVLKKNQKILNQDYLIRWQKYQNYEKILGKRNSFSKTDHDATFMRMKDDHMKNGQLKAAYNIQVGTENQFIVGYSIHQKSTDTSHMVPHLKKIKNQLGKFPENIITDSGYGSEENYSFLEKEKVNSYVKFNYFHKEMTRKYKKQIFRVENLKYDKNKDEYICPAGKKLSYVYTKKYTTDNGYETTRRYYQCENCVGCQFRNECHRSKYNRRIQVSFELNKYKEKARKNLKSEKGIKLRSMRGVEVESVFGQIKQNTGFKRFNLRGKEKVNLEWGLISLAHNMKKVHINV